MSLDTAVQNETSFAELNLPDALMKAVAKLGFTTPSAIQAQAIPHLLAGRDITGVAQTGTGKTAAFGLPLLAQINPNVRAVQALVLTPTRELALQVAEAVESFASHLGSVNVVAVYGGAPYPAQIRALQAGAQVVVGTPGRVIDHLKRGTLKLDQVHFLVLDEADEMLRMGFAEDVEQIFSFAPKEGRQVALFSATMPPAIRSVAANHLNNPVEIAVARQSSTTENVTQGYAVVPFRHKVGSLSRILATSDTDAAIVFCRTRSSAEEVGAALLERGILAATISGDVAQKEREKIVERLRSGALDVLVATDVAARGLDVDRIGLVVNFDIPGEPEAYVHRIGRTGRAGRSGQAISFITPHERGKLRNIERTIRQSISEVQIPTPADVSAHKAKKLQEQIANRIELGRLDLYKNLITQSLADKSLDLVDVAAALMAVNVGDSGPRARAEQDEYEAQKAETQKLAKEPARGAKHGLDGRKERHGRGSDRGGERVRYRLEVGHSHGVGPSGIVGALTNEGGLSGKDLGKLDIFQNFSLIDISVPLDAKTLDRLSKARVGGKSLRIRLDRGPKSNAAPKGRGPRGERERDGYREGGFRDGKARRQKSGFRG